MKSDVKKTIQRHDARVSNAHHEDELEYTTEIVLLPSRWTILMGFKLGYIMRVVNSATSGWQISLRALHVVADDAMIFEFCRQGNLQAVMTLCERGLASVHDADSKGRTPLHVREAP